MSKTKNITIDLTAYEANSLSLAISEHLDSLDYYQSNISKEKAALTRALNKIFKAQRKKSSKENEN